MMIGVTHTHTSETDTQDVSSVPGRIKLRHTVFLTTWQTELEMKHENSTYSGGARAQIPPFLVSPLLGEICVKKAASSSKWCTVVRLIFIGESCASFTLWFTAKKSLKAGTDSHHFENLQRAKKGQLKKGPTRWFHCFCFTRISTFLTQRSTHRHYASEGETGGGCAIHQVHFFRCWFQMTPRIFLFTFQFSSFLFLEKSVGASQSPELILLIEKNWMEKM